MKNIGTSSLTLILSFPLALAISQSAFSAVKVCNEGQRVKYVAYAYETIGGYCTGASDLGGCHGTTVTTLESKAIGWYQVDPGQCSTLYSLSNTNLNNRSFYFHIQNDISGKVRICTNEYNRFTYRKSERIEGISINPVLADSEGRYDHPSLGDCSNLICDSNGGNCPSSLGTPLLYHEFQVTDQDFTIRVADPAS